MPEPELTGYTPAQLAEAKEDFDEEARGLSFEVYYCLAKIPNQPSDYDGPTRYCMEAARRKRGFQTDDPHPSWVENACKHHGGAKGMKDGDASRLPDGEIAGIKHGLYAEDEHLRMDFNDAEQQLYDSIMEEWPDIYDWPTEDEDPARYLILRKVATNVVRSNRAEDYLDDEGEVHFRDAIAEDGTVVEEDKIPEENTLSREYRLLLNQMMDMMRELGITPKARQQMDTMEAEQSKDEAVADIASDALDSDDGDYDPDEF